MSDPEYLKLLEIQDWPRIYIDLVLYAHEQAAAKPSWGKGKRGFEIKTDSTLNTAAVTKQPMLAQGKTPEDIVQMVLLKITEGVGKWRWDPARNSDIQVHAKYRIRGLTSDLVRNKENVNWVPVPLDKDNNERYDWLDKASPEQRSSIELTELAGASEPDCDYEDEPEDISKVLDDRLKTGAGAKEAAEAFRLACEGDDDLQIVTDYLINGTPPRHISRELGIPIEKVNALKKRLKRKLKQHLTN